MFPKKGSKVSKNVFFCAKIVADIVNPALYFIFAFIYAYIYDVFQWCFDVMWNMYVFYAQPFLFHTIT